MNTPVDKVNLLDFDRTGLRDFFAQLGEKPYRAEQVMKWIYHRLESDFENMTDVGKALREKLSASCYVGPPKTAFEKTGEAMAALAEGDASKVAEMQTLATDLQGSITSFQELCLP